MSKMACARSYINGVWARWRDGGNKPNNDGSCSGHINQSNRALHHWSDRSGRTTRLDNLMSTQSAVNSQTSRNSTVTASARAAASASDRMRKRRTASSLYCAGNDVGGVKSAWEEMMAAGSRASGDGGFHISRRARSRHCCHCTNKPLLGCSR